MRAVWNGQTVAESGDIVTIEGNAYFPKAALRQEFLRPSEHRTSCPWKGLAEYYTLEVDGKSNVDSAWYYANPRPAAAEIKDRVAFWKGVRIEA